MSEDSALRSVRSLEHSLDDGSWEIAYGRLRTASHFDGSLVLITAEG
ncbi:hypothetical protein [Brevibacterium sp. RIT 803]|nr:hypothetical protein [Brevibacterium sp. RIT 803]